MTSSVGDTSEIVAAFIAFVGGRNFVTFDELVLGLGVEKLTLMALKEDFETALRRRNPGISVTSRTDLNPPGFEIEE